MDSGIIEGPSLLELELATKLGEANPGVEAGRIPPEDASWLT
jgi:hypothetical protein